MNRTETRQRLIDLGIIAERLPIDGQFNLSRADLSWADLRWADLRWADLSWADLSGADLRWADLRRADLRRADLRGADLSGADLRRAVGPFTVGSFGRHTAVAAGGDISIGSERHTYDWWLTNYEACGQRNDYTAEEIADYGAWIQIAVARQRRIERPEAAGMSPDDLRDEADRQS
jgi:hypothetical protein